MGEAGYNAATSTCEAVDSSGYSYSHGARGHVALTAWDVVEVSPVLCSRLR